MTEMIFGIYRNADPQFCAHVILTHTKYDLCALATSKLDKIATYINTFLA